MTSVVPEGHPGDHAWRLPVWRTLLRLSLVNPSQLEPANALAKHGGFFLSHLVTLGVNSDKLLTAIAVATGLPSAARHDVRRPNPELAEGLDGALLRSILASPFKKEGGLLHLAFVVPIPKDRLAALPRHKACVALESDIRDGLDVLFPKAKPGAAPDFDTDLLGLPPPPSAPAPSDNPVPEPAKAPGLWGQLRAKLFKGT